MCEADFETNFDPSEVAPDGVFPCIDTMQRKFAAQEIRAALNLAMRASDFELNGTSLYP